jgi:Putative restriction endonuclease
MAKKTPSLLSQFSNFADLHKQLGYVPLNRICLDPAPGRATEADALRFQESKILPICELIDGTLVARTNDSSESVCAAALSTTLHNLDSELELGIASHGNLPIRLRAGLIRFVNVGFTRWDSLPGQRYPLGDFWPTVPQLAFDFVNPGHTQAEYERKLQQFFKFGCKKFCQVNCTTKTVRVFSSPSRCQTLSGQQFLPPLCHHKSLLSRMSRFANWWAVNDSSASSRLPLSESPPCGGNFRLANKHAVTIQNTKYDS